MSVPQIQHKTDKAHRMIRRDRCRSRRKRANAEDNATIEPCQRRWEKIVYTKSLLNVLMYKGHIGEIPCTIIILCVCSFYYVVSADS